MPSRRSRGSRRRRRARWSWPAAAWRAPSTSPKRLARSDLERRHAHRSRRALLRGRAAAAAGDAAADALQFGGLAVPGVRDAALPARRVPRDPQAGARRQDQRRRARGVRGRGAQVPRRQRRAARAGPVDADAGVRARAGGRTPAAGPRCEWVRVMLGVDHRGPGAAARLHQGADSGLAADVAGGRRARAHRHRHARAGGHAGDHRQDARPRAARRRAARAAGQLRDHQRAGADRCRST